MFCPKCKQRDNAKQINGFEDLKGIQKKRYGKIPCRYCMIELVGGQKEYEIQETVRIIIEMGIK